MYMFLFGRELATDEVIECRLAFFSVQLLSFSALQGSEVLAAVAAAVNAIPAAISQAERLLNIAEIFQYGVPEALIEGQEIPRYLYFYNDRLTEPGDYTPFICPYNYRLVSGSTFPFALPAVSVTGLTITVSLVVFLSLTYIREEFPLPVFSVPYGHVLEDLPGSTYRISYKRPSIAGWASGNFIIANQLRETYVEQDESADINTTFLFGFDFPQPLPEHHMFANMDACTTTLLSIRQQHVIAHYAPGYDILYSWFAGTTRIRTEDGFVPTWYNYGRKLEVRTPEYWTPTSPEFGVTIIPPYIDVVLPPIYDFTKIGGGLLLPVILVTQALTGTPLLPVMLATQGLTGSIRQPGA